MATVLAIASLPDMIRGFGPVKDNARAKAEERRAALLAQLTDPPVVAMAAE
jgi:indolepyruvate ferredoxin oxidoreductase